jgi:hypothetical protein
VFGRNLQRGEYLRRPIALGEIEEDRSRAVGFVDAECACHFVAYIILGQKDMARVFPNFGFVFLHPQDFRRSEICQRVVARDADQVPPSEFEADGVTLRSSALVVP